MGLGKLFNVSGHRHGLNELERESSPVAPATKLTDRLRVCCAGVFVPDIGSEKLEEPAAGLLTLCGDDFWNGLAEERCQALRNIAAGVPSWGAFCHFGQ